MDKIDHKILLALSKNARISGAAIARKVHLSVPAVTERLRKLDKSGIIDKYTIQINRNKLGLNLLAYIKVWIDHSKAENIIQWIIDFPEVLECHHIAGDYDILLKVLVKDTKELDSFLTEKLKTKNSISNTSTTIILNTYKESSFTKIELI